MAAMLSLVTPVRSESASDTPAAAHVADSGIVSAEARIRFEKNLHAEYVIKALADSGKTEQFLFAILKADNNVASVAKRGE